MVAIALVDRLSGRRIVALLERAAKAGRMGPSYWLLLVSGIVEPLLYLLSIGVGVGSLIIRPVSYHGLAVDYPQYVAPAMLAFSALGGAFSEAVYGFFGRLRFAGVFENAFAAGVSPADIVVGELISATIRSSLYSALFLIVMVAMGLTGPGPALAAWPAAALVGAAFSALGLLAGALLRSWQDIEFVVVGQLAMFLFSGTFSPVGDYPAGVRVVVEATPLYHGIELVRAISLGDVRPGLWWHAVYLIALVPVCAWLANRLVAKALRS